MNKNTVAKCMGIYKENPCTNVYSHEFLINKLSRAWYETEYKPILKTLLFDMEQAQMPNTQIYVERDNEIESLKSENVAIVSQIKDLEMQINCLRNRRDRNLIAMRTDAVIVSDRKFIMQCPFDCNGFLSTKYKCGLCNLNACPECLGLKEEAHVCNEEQRLSTQLIHRESKPCPKCGTRICKISGCDQMYCTAIQSGIHCNTAFSWKTGQIVTGHIHNPHFYELQHKNGVVLRNVGDTVCGGMPNMPPLNRYVAELTKIVGILNHTNVSMIAPSLQRIHRSLCELNQYTIGPMREKLRDHEIVLRKYRVRYLKNEVTKDELKELVYKQYIYNQYITDVYNVYEVFTTTGIDVFNEIRNLITTFLEELPTLLSKGLESIANLNGCLTKLAYVRDYCNGELRLISSEYNKTVHIFTSAYSTTSAKYKMNGDLMGSNKRVKKM
jgi:hypothetical protein